MATIVRTCRVCGKEYEVCATARRVDGVFRWQEVACSPNCGEEYLAAVLRGRARDADEEEKSYQYEEYENEIEEDEDDIIDDTEEDVSVDEDQ